MFSDFGLSAKQIFWGNLLLVVCCAFYLAWWGLAFKPVGGIRDMRTGWLLIPAAAAGLASILFTTRGISGATMKSRLLPMGMLLWGGVVAYLLLMAITLLLFKRPVTTELILIVGWAVLAAAEINTLYGTGRLSHRAAVTFLAVIAAATLISLVCYVLYYGLDARAGYLDGMVPLLMAALVTAGIMVGMVCR